jgi:hypothetical protein
MLGQMNKAKLLREAVSMEFLLAARRPMRSQ